MRPLMWMQPRSRPAAIRSIITLSVVAAVVTIGFTPIQPGGRDLTWAEAGLTLFGVGLFATACWVTRHRPNAPMIAWALGPLLSVGLIIEVVSGRSVDEEFQARFTGPLGLAQTRLLGPADVQLPPAWSTAFWTSGAMVSTPTELARWGQALYGGSVISPAGLLRMLDFRSGSHYGEGAQLLPLGGRLVPGHSGLIYETTPCSSTFPRASPSPLRRRPRIRTSRRRW